MRRFRGIEMRQIGPPKMAHLLAFFKRCAKLALRKRRIFEKKDAPNSGPAKTAHLFAFFQKFSKICHFLQLFLPRKTPKFCQKKDAPFFGLLFPIFMKNLQIFQILQFLFSIFSRENGACQMRQIRLPENGASFYPNLERKRRIFCTRKRRIFLHFLPIFLNI